ncbi:MAG: ATP-dependent DNA ligase [Candidatus Dormibacteria bacterium]
MELPFALPITPMLSKGAPALPVGPNLVYEPKWDGFRALAVRRDSGAQIWSRQGKRLEAQFPELVAALIAEFMPGTVLDGELVVLRGDGAIDFDALCTRQSAGPRSAVGLGASMPASYAVFDVLADVGLDVRRDPLARRRARLEGMVGPSDRIALMPQTDLPEAATGWYEFAERGVEGVVVKDLRDPYRAGRRGWLKLRWKAAAEAVIGGWSRRRLLLGMYDRAGILQYVGATRALGGEHESVLRLVRKSAAGTAFLGGSKPGTGRFDNQRLQEWSEVEPHQVCEVTFDAVSSGRFRHDPEFLRLRGDVEPRECHRDQLRQRAWQPGRLTL